MTNEEAINELLQCYSLYSPFKTAKKTNEAISMAIAALDKDIDVPSKSVLDHIHNVVRDDAYKRGYEQGKADANHPENPDSWIPVTKKMPEEKDAGILKKLGTNKKSDYVIATVDVKGERMTVTACTYDGAWDWNMKYAFPDYKIIAWMPLPEPYKEGEENENVN